MFDDGLSQDCLALLDLPTETLREMAAIAEGHRLRSYGLAGPAVRDLASPMQRALEMLETGYSETRERLAAAVAGELLDLAEQTSGHAASRAQAEGAAQFAGLLLSLATEPIDILNRGKERLLSTYCVFARQAIRE